MYFVFSSSFSNYFLQYIYFLGGTIDIIVHEVCTDGTLKEIYQANGGNWGGTMVDKTVQDFLTKI